MLFDLLGNRYGNALKHVTFFGIVQRCIIESKDLVVFAEVHHFYELKGRLKRTAQNAIVKQWNYISDFALATTSRADENSEAIVFLVL